MTVAELRKGALASLEYHVRACVQCVGIHALTPTQDILSRDSMCNTHVAALDAINDEWPPCSTCGGDGRVEVWCLCGGKTPRCQRCEGGGIYSTGCPACPEGASSGRIDHPHNGIVTRTQRGRSVYTPPSDPPATIPPKTPRGRR